MIRNPVACGCPNKQRLTPGTGLGLLQGYELIPTNRGCAARPRAVVRLAFTCFTEPLHFDHKSSRAPLLAARYADVLCTVRPLICNLTCIRNLPSLSTARFSPSVRSSAHLHSAAPNCLRNVNYRCQYVKTPTPSMRSLPPHQPSHPWSLGPTMALLYAHAGYD